MGWVEAVVSTYHEEIGLEARGGGDFPGEVNVGWDTPNVVPSVWEGEYLNDRCLFPLVIAKNLRSLVSRTIVDDGYLLWFQSLPE